jgi:hypothetical protein
VPSDLGAAGWRARWGDQRGNTLVLMPTAVLVVVLLSAIAVDAATVFLGQRRLADLAAGLATDAVAAVDEAAFYGRGDIELVRARVEVRRDAVLATVREDTSLHDVACAVETDLDVAVVSCTGRARPIFARAIPFAAESYPIRATETARAEQG